MHLVCQIQRVYYSTFVSHFLVIIRAVHLIEQLALPSLMWFGQGVASQQKNIIYNFWYIYLCQFEFRFNFLCIVITYLWNICFAHMGMNPLTWHALLMRRILYEMLKRLEGFKGSADIVWLTKGSSEYEGWETLF